MGDFGTFRISFSSEGVDDPKTFSTDKINSLKIIFTPGVDFKKELSAIKFETE